MGQHWPGRKKHFARECSGCPGGSATEVASGTGSQRPHRGVRTRVPEVSFEDVGAGGAASRRRSRLLRDWAAQETHALPHGLRRHVSEDLLALPWSGPAAQGSMRWHWRPPVSYTHLTLPDNLLPASSTCVYVRADVHAPPVLARPCPRQVWTRGPVRDKAGPHMQNALPPHRRCFGRRSGHAATSSTRITACPRSHLGICSSTP